MIKNRTPLVLALASFAFLALARPSHAEIIPAERRTTWNPGMPGGVPARTTVCATVNASTYGNGSQNATAGIQSAINACPVGQVVQLSAGTFRISSGPIRLNKGVVLRGAGPTQTLLQGATTDQAVIVIGQQWPSSGSSTNLTANAVKGANSVTVASVSGLTVGEIVLVDQLTDTSITQWSDTSPLGDPSRGWFSRTNRPVAQAMEIASISGNTVTFTTPFHIGFDTAHTAQLMQYGPAAVKYAGLEDLHVYGGQGGDGGGNVRMELAAYSWVKKVESEYSKGGSIVLTTTFRCIVRDSYLHETPNPNPGGEGYGFSINSASSDNLIENNIVWNFNKVIVMRASGGGNVIAYNYMEDGYGAGYKSIVEIGLNASHMTTPHYELFEGNQAFNIDGDARWGNSVYITYFRNHVTTVRRSLAGLGLTDVGNRHAIGAQAGHWWYNFVGNVLGYSGMTPAPGGSSFVYESQSWSDPVPMWKLGYGDSVGHPGYDPQVAATVLREGNFDYFTNTVRWDTTAQTIPASLYLTSKPAFFGSLPWPWVDPTGATKLYTLPARARFDSGVPIPHVEVAAISPVSGSTDGGTRVTVRGSGFAAGSTVTIGGVPATGVVVSGSTSLAAVTGAHATGLADVTVTIPGLLPATLAKGYFYAPPPTLSSYYTLVPCRVADTRGPQGPALGAFERRVFAVAGRCGVPATAISVALNVTITGAVAAGHIRLAPGNGLTDSSAINFAPGQTRANNATLLLATDDTGGMAASNYSMGPVHLILDVSGYFQ